MGASSPTGLVIVRADVIVSVQMYKQQSHVGIAHGTLGVIGGGKNRIMIEAKTNNK